jgi:hypothetical protein
MLSQFLHEVNGAHNGVGHAGSSKVLLDLPLALEMWDSGTLVCTPNRTIDEVTDLGTTRRVNESDPLPRLGFDSAFIGRLNRKNAVHII